MPLPTIPDCEINEWLALTSCRWRNWRMATGRIPQGFLWVWDGAATARLLGMMAKILRRMFWKHFAILDTPVAVPGRRWNVRGMRCDSRFPLHRVGTARRAAQTACPRASFFAAAR